MVNWFSFNKFPKSEVSFFGKGNSSNLTLHRKLPNMVSCKYIGVYQDIELTCRDHIDSTTKTSEFCGISYKVRDVFIDDWIFSVSINLLFYPS